MRGRNQELYLQRNCLVQHEAQPLFLRGSQQQNLRCLTLLPVDRRPPRTPRRKKFISGL